MKDKKRNKDLSRLELILGIETDTFFQIEGLDGNWKLTQNTIINEDGAFLNSNDLLRLINNPNLLIIDSDCLVSRLPHKIASSIQFIIVCLGLCLILLKMRFLSLLLGVECMYIMLLSFLCVLIGMHINKIFRILRYYEKYYA